MKRIILMAITVIFVVISFSFLVLADEMTPKSVADVLLEIRQEQGIGSTDPIDVDKVSDAKLEELGDSVMEAIIGNSAMHDQMDINLGGDGSATLTAFHIRLGYNYLSGYPVGMMNLMSGGMMNNYQGGMMNNGKVGMMGSYQVGKLSAFDQNSSINDTVDWAGIVVGVLFFVSLTLNIILVIKVSKVSQKPRS